MGMIGRIYAIVGADTSEFTTKMGAVSAKAKAVGMGLSKALTVPLLAIGAAAVKVSMDFEQKLTNAIAVTGDYSEETERKMESLARTMGATTAYSAGEAADAMYYMASAGWKAEEMTVALESTLKLAGATGSDLAFTTDKMVASLNMFGMAAADAGKVADVYANAISNSQATMEKLGVSMGYIGPVANALNFTLEDTTTALMALYNKGIDAGTAGTSLRMALTKLMDGSKKTTDGLKAMGLSLDDVSPKTHTLAEIVEVLEGNAMDAYDAVKIFGVRGANAMLNLTDTGKKGLGELRDSLDKTGTAVEMYDKRMDTLSGQFEIFKSALSEAAIQLGKVLIPIIKDFLQNQLMPMVKWFQNLSEGTKETIVKVAGLAAAIGPVLLIFSKFTGMLPGLVSKIQLVGKALMFLATNPIGIVITIVGVLAFVIYKNWDKIKTFTITIWNYIRAFLIAFWDTIGSKIAAYWQFIFKLWKAGATGVINIAKMIGSFLGKVFGGTYNFVKKIFIGIATFIIEALKKLAGKLAKLPLVKKFGEKMKEALANVTAGLEDTTEAMDDTSVASGELAAEEEALKKATLNLEPPLMSVRDKIQEVVDKQEAAKAAAEAWAARLEEMGIKTIPQKAAAVETLYGEIDHLTKMYEAGQITLEDYENAINTLEAEIESLSTTMTTTAVPAANDMFDVLKNAPGVVEEQYLDMSKTIKTETKKTTSESKEMWDNFTDGIKTKWVNTISDVITGSATLKDAFKGLFDSILGEFVDMLSQMVAKWTVNFLGKMLTGAGDMFSNLLGKAGGFFSSLTEGAGETASTVVGSFKDVSSSALDLAKGFNPGGMIASAIGSAIGTFLGGLIGPKGAGQRDTQMIKDNTWLTANVLQKNVVTNLDAIKWSLWNIEPQINDMKLCLWSVYEVLKGGSGGDDTSGGDTGGGGGDGGNTVKILRAIRANTGAMVKAIRRIGRLQHGGIVTAPQLAFIGEAGPEAVIPLDRLAEVGGGGGGGESNYSINFSIQTLDSSGFQGIVEKKIFPAIVKIIDTNKGGARTNIVSAQRIKRRLGR